jgi:hypothetical protein
MTRSLRQLTALLAVTLLALATTACGDLLSLTGPSPAPGGGEVTTVGFAAGGSVDAPAE